MLSEEKQKLLSKIVQDHESAKLKRKQEKEAARIEAEFEDIKKNKVKGDGTIPPPFFMPHDTMTRDQVIRKAQDETHKRSFVIERAESAESDDRTVDLAFASDIPYPLTSLTP